MLPPVGPPVGPPVASRRICTSPPRFVDGAAPAGGENGGRAHEAPLRVLHRLHSGHVGDDVAWLMMGVAVLAGFIGLPLR